MPETADVVGLHLAEDGLAWDAPPATESVRRSLTFPAATPAVTFMVPLGHVRLAAPLEVVGDGVFTIWVTADQAAVLSQLRVDVYRNADHIASGTTNQRLDGDEPDSLVLAPDAPRRLSVGVPLRGVRFEAEDVVELAVSAFGAAVNGQDDINVLALLGSTQHASALTFPVSAAGELPVLGRLSSLYLADDALAPSPPRSERVEEQRSAPGLSEKEWVWARYRIDHGFTLVADTSATLWIETGPGATVAHGRGVRVLLYVDDLVVSQNTGMLDASAAEATAPDSQVVVGLPTRGLEVPAGSDLRLAFSFLAPPPEAQGSVRVVYGGPHRPSGLAFPIQAHAEPSPEPAASAPSAVVEDSPAPSAPATPTVPDPPADEPKQEHPPPAPAEPARLPAPGSILTGLAAVFVARRAFAKP